MNIDDIKDIPENITIEMVFKEQKRLMVVYGEIEGRHYPVNLDTREGQSVVKDFLWRITEEVGEALDSTLGINHIREELADAFHFLIELFIFTETTYTKCWSWESSKCTAQDLGPAALPCLWINLARVGRICKNKPWKQTEIPIDIHAFKESLWNLNAAFLIYCSPYFDSLEQLYQFYFKKAQVNKFRQKSHY